MARARKTTTEIALNPKFLGPSSYNSEREDWILIGGSVLRNIHPESDCVKPCPIHDPSPHHMVEWRQAFDLPDEVLVNAVGEYVFKFPLMVRVCEHGNYHLDPDSTAMVAHQILTCRCWCCWPERPQQKLKLP